MAYISAFDLETQENITSEKRDHFHKQSCIGSKVQYKTHENIKRKGVQLHEEVKKHRCLRIPVSKLSDLWNLLILSRFLRLYILSLFKTNKMGQAKLFVGLGNYKELLQSSSFWNSLAVTLIFVVIVVAVSMILGLTTAVLCNKTFPGIRFFSTAYALPMAIASSSAAMIFKIMLHPSVGIINKIFHLDINWVSDPKYALICVAVLTAWLNSGINFLYFSAGLSNIDETIYERASVDGASSFQKFYRLTLPGLAPMMFYTLVVNIIQAFQSFGQVKILTQGGPGESTNLIVYSIYRDAFFNYRFGSAAAQSVVLFLIVLVLTLVMFKIEKKGVKY